MKLAELSPPGHTVVTGSLLFTAEDIIAFAKKFDPQPFHTDPEAARNYVFGGLCASGWHTCAGWMKTFSPTGRRNTRALSPKASFRRSLAPHPASRNCNG